MHPVRVLRLFSTAHVNTKEHLDIDTVGDESHGKSTLCRAILKTVDANQALHGTNEDKLGQLGQSRSIKLEFECAILVVSAVDASCYNTSARPS